MHSSRMRTARSLTVSLCVVVSPPSNHTRTPREQPRTPPPPEQPRTPPPVNRMTNWCKNITLPQTSFAGGNNLSQCSFSPKVCDCSAAVLKPRNYYGYKYMLVFANAWRNGALRIKCHFLEYGIGNVGINVNFRSHFRKVLTNLNKVRQCPHSGFICTVPTSVFRSPFPNAGVGLR